ncbi:MAG: hypothetical protein JW782_01125 [Candidatus Saganbacteria bacterium]|nr:hypothetical protein [Candidatus Saganbacteria bacterium]
MIKKIAACLLILVLNTALSFAAPIDPGDMVPIVTDPATGTILLTDTGTYAVPSAMNIQGRAMDDAGSPLSGSQSMTFRIYKIETGGSAVWSKNYSVNIEADNLGVFNVIIGGDDDTGRDFPEFRTETHYLEIVLNGRALVPRQRLVSVPYAITSRNLVGGSAKIGYDKQLYGSGVPLTYAVGAFGQSPSAVEIGSGASGYDAFINDDLFVNKKLHVGLDGIEIVRNHGNFIEMVKNDGTRPYTWRFHTGNPAQPNPGRLEIGFTDGITDKWEIMTFHTNGAVCAGTQDPVANVTLTVKGADATGASAIVGRTHSASTTLSSGNTGVAGLSTGDFSKGVYGEGRIGVFGMTTGSNRYAGVVGEAPHGLAGGYGVVGIGDILRDGSIGVYGSGHPGVKGYSGSTAIEGVTTVGVGVYAHSTNLGAGTALKVECAAPNSSAIEIGKGRISVTDIGRDTYQTMWSSSDTNQQRYEGSKPFGVVEDTNRSRVNDLGIVHIRNPHLTDNSVVMVAVHTPVGKQWYYNVCNVTGSSSDLLINGRYIYVRFANRVLVGEAFKITYFIVN